MYKFRDWLFNLLIDYWVNSGWTIVIKDFKKSKERSGRLTLGELCREDKIICLDKDEGPPKVLVHEICHFGLGTVLDKMSESMPWKNLKKVKGRCRSDKQFNWEELRTEEFEELFYNSLTKRQIKTLQGFIDEARTRYEGEG